MRSFAEIADDEMEKKALLDERTNTYSERSEIIEGFEGYVFKGRFQEPWTIHLGTCQKWANVGESNGAEYIESFYDFKYMRAWVFIHDDRYDSEEFYKLVKKGTSLLLMNEKSEVKETYTSKSSIYQTFLIYERYHSEAGLRERRELEAKRLEAALKLNNVTIPVYVAPVDSQGNLSLMDKNKFLRDLGL